jgi:hypothetical protein
MRFADSIEKIKMDEALVAKIQRIFDGVVKVINSLSHLKIKTSSKELVLF